jgi:hypothetical protein
MQPAVRAAGKRVLKKRKVRREYLEPFLGSILVQAEALYADWPLGEVVNASSEQSSPYIKRISSFHD